MPTPHRPQAFDWVAAMAFGLGTLKLPPAVFWAMTPRELQAAMTGVYGPESPPPVSRTELVELMARFPD
jgi:uncharacterized phage protein (TIGR02216 family)